MFFMMQKEAMDILKAGYNVFLTGAAGSGKTYLLNQDVAYLRAHGVGVAVTASTGIAATHLNGQTIHSWSGIGVRDALSDDDIKALASRERIARNFKKTKVLVIDEVSMLHAHQLGMVERIARHMCDFALPFGGLQVILCGDFFQLPPVVREEGDTSRGKSEKKFAYECAAWENGAFQVCYLHEQFRQNASADLLLKVLNDIRSGQADEDTKIPLRARYKKPPVISTGNAIRPTKLYSHNVNVDALNEKELEKLSGESKIFHMETRGFPALVQMLKKGCLAPEKLRLKIGAEVLFVKNDTRGRYVNGTRGVVKGFDTHEKWPIVRMGNGRTIMAEPDEWYLGENDIVRGALVQVPLRLAWAITIHKSQGMTLDAAEVDLSDAFESGMGYVALSRVRTLGGLTLMGLNDTALMVHPKILAYDVRLKELSRDARTALARLSAEELAAQHEETLFSRFNGVRDVALVKKHKEDKKRKKKIPTHLITAEFLEKKMPLAMIAKERGLTEGTLLGHMEKLKGTRTLPDISYLKKDISDFEKIFAVFQKSPDGKLTPIFEKFDGTHSFDTLKLVRLFI